ncbi:IS66 family transposase [Variovorax sp. J22R24]|uniref:IS66 family transposase n=1 Tax=Variovorax gracilis TaxID=3053502 RepID=UPI002577B53C|nr:IS66 family transposase [Variovorax sp. J22R24]MDM0106591.1 IS66 family transposase [Variovorax sp. J22R24]
MLVSKYFDHIPLHRLSRIYGRDGVVIDRSTMAGWVGQREKLFDPLVAALGRYVLAGEKVHADDTPVGGRARSRPGPHQDRSLVGLRARRLAGWQHRTACGLVSLLAQRRGEHPQAHLASYSGILQADAYGGYGKIYSSGHVVGASCWAHARRPFSDLHESQGFVPGSIAEQALQRIAALYAIEAQIRGQPPGVRRQVRQAPLRDVAMSKLPMSRRPSRSGRRPLRASSQRGDTVTFNDREGRNVTGVIVRINQRTAALGTGDGETWRVPFHVLRHVLEV